MLDYAQTHIFDAVTTCGRYQGRLLLILILHSIMHDITSTLPVCVNLQLGFNAKWPPHVNRRRAPGVLRLGFNGYVSRYYRFTNNVIRKPDSMTMFSMFSPESVPCRSPTYVGDVAYTPFADMDVVVCVLLAQW